jgi:hypothetical protein
MAQVCTSFFAGLLRQVEVMNARKAKLRSDYSDTLHAMHSLASTFGT